MTIEQSDRCEANLVEDVKRLESLKIELRNVEKRREEIRVEVKNIFSRIGQIAPEFSLEGSNRRTKPVPERPRSLQDKLLISAGRAAIQAIKDGKTEAQCIAAAVTAATNLSVKKGIKELDPSVVAAIEQKVQLRFLYMPRQTSTVQ